MCSVFVIFESAFSNMMQLKSYTNRMADGTCMPACAWRLRKLKRTLTLSPKTRNKELICYFVGVLFIFFLAEKLYFESQTNKQTENSKFTLQSKIASDVQQNEVC